ncbi:MAG: acyltransferase [Planctomycetaceae bacterium]|nr:acyltransferase [Planctomycetaceae bacterium]
MIQHGYLGVQLFFVISGYCITAALYGAVRKPKALSYFMLRRLRRIFPPYWASIVLVIALGMLTILVLKTPQAVVFPLTAFDWLCNLFLLQGPLHAKDANLVYWSLSIEVQFYVVMAMALLNSRWTEAWLVFVSGLFLMVDHLTAWPLWGTVIVYWPEFLCGIAAYYRLTGKARWKWSPAVLVGFVLLDIVMQWGQYETLTLANGRFIQPVKLLFCLACMLVMVSLRRSDKVICSRRPIRLLGWFGLISYSLYLTHVPVGTRLFNLTDRVIGLSGLRWLAVLPVAAAVSTVFAWLFFHWFESPWLNASSRKSPEFSMAVPPVHESVAS